MTTPKPKPPAHPDTRPLSQAQSGSLRGALKALDRAFQAAERIAAQTNTPLIVQQNGKLIHMKAK
jgi:Cdc6-like AAA superfamily ATPase